MYNETYKSEIFGRLMKKTDFNKSLENANVAFDNAQYSKALSLVKKINKSPLLKTFKSVELQANSLLKMGKSDKALAVYKELIDLSVNDNQRLIIYKAIGQIEITNIAYKEATKALESCVAIDNSLDNAEVILQLCKLYRKQKYYSACENLANKLKKWSNYFAPALHQLILIAKAQNNTDLIISRTRELANNYRHINDFYIYYSIQSFLSVDCFDEGRLLLEKAEVFLGKLPWLSRLKAEFCFENKEYQQVIELLNDNLIQQLPSWVYKTLVHQLRGQAYERMNLFDDAFNDFSAMAKMVKNKFKNTSVMDDVKKYMSLDITSLPINNGYQSKFKLAFMMGFPRSGTTLLDVILSTQTNVVTLSEVDTISYIIKLISSKLNKKYPQDLGRLTASEINVLRQDYYDFVGQLPQAENITPDTLVVDKMPLYSIHIPLLLIMFPESKFIFSLRHPLDVCLSNFQQDYVINQEMYYLIELKDCANRYNQVFNLLERYQENLNVDLYFIKYENLVHNLPDEVSNLFNYLGVSIDGSYSSFNQFVKGEFIKTPSSKQVKKPLYTSSINKWKSYRAKLNDIIPLLQTHIERYGYIDECSID